MKPWKKLKEHTFKAGWFPLVNKTFEMSNGKIDDFTCLHKKDVVTVFMLTEEQKVVLAKQFRPGPEKIMLDPPGGNVDEGQTPDQAAISELVEETGYSFKSMEYVGSCYQDAYETRKRHIFVALGCQRSQEQNLQETEIIEVEEMPLKDYFALTVKGDQSTDSLIIFRALLHLGYLQAKLP